MSRMRCFVLKRSNAVCLQISAPPSNARQPQQMRSKLCVVASIRCVHDKFGEISEIVKLLSDAHAGHRPCKARGLFKWRHAAPRGAGSAAGAGARGAVWRHDAGGVGLGRQGVHALGAGEPWSGG